MSAPTETDRMPYLAGYYFDSSTNRYYKGTRPQPPPEIPNPISATTLPRLLHATELGLPTTTANLHATLLNTATNHQITPTLTQNDAITPIPQHSAISPTETFAHKPFGTPEIFVVAFPKLQLNHLEYPSNFEPIELVSYGCNLAYATGDGVYVHERMGSTNIYRRYSLRMNTVSLSANHVLMAGHDARLYKLSGSVIPRRPLATPSARRVLCSDMVNPSNFALGTRDGRVVLADSTSFHPNGKQRSVTDVKIKDNLVWCSTMGDEMGISAWDVRCLLSPALVCRGQSNLYKMVGLDVSDAIVIAGGDDQHVRVWDVRGGEVLSRIKVPGVVKRIKMAGWRSRADGMCGVWFDFGNQVLARIVST